MRLSFQKLTIFSCFIIASLCLASCLKPSNTNNPSLKIEETKNRWGNGISIEKVDATVLFSGNIAETTLDLTIKNSTSRVLEASLDLPLPEGASISRYALEVEGTIREGVVVDKEQGRVAFDNTIRGLIDPGLLEKTSGNNFRTRIYPVPAKGTKRLILSYTEPMVSKQSSYYHYKLPLAIKKPVSQFTLRMKSNIGFIPIYPENKISGFPAPNPQKNEYLLSKKYYQSKNHSFLIAKQATASAIIQKGNDGAHYFYLSKQIPAQTQLYPRAKARKVHLIWDSSHSSLLRDHKKELDLLDQYFNHQETSTIDLTWLSNSSTAKQSYTHFSKARAALENTIYDGATRLDQLDLRGDQYDTVIYVGDGISTLGKSTPKYGNTPILILNSSPQANHQLLRLLAKKSNGSYVNLEQSNTEQALQQMVTAPYELLNVKSSGSTKLDFNSLTGTATVVGKMTAPNSKLTLNYGVNGKVHKTETINISQAEHKRSGTMAAKLWAQSQVDQLSISAKQHKKRIIELGKTHHLVTDYTSLIVLDRISDYVIYDILPPTEKLRKQFYELKKTLTKSEQGEPADLDDIYHNWKRMVAWHQAEFPRSTYDQFNWENPLWRNNVSNILTSGLRSGDFAISSDHIDFFLAPVSANSLFTGNIDSFFIGGGTFRPNQVGKAIQYKGESSANKAHLQHFKKTQPEKYAFLSQKNKSFHTKFIGKLPSTLYNRELTKAIKNQQPLLPIYLKWKPKHNNNPGFYIDSAECFIINGQLEEAKKILSTLAELDPESPELLRVLASKYAQMGEYVLAEMLLREVLDIREEEPQSHRDLALILIKLKQYSEASKLLWKVASTKWHNRFPAIEMIALNEWNHVMQLSGKTTTSSQKRFRHNIDTDLRIVLTWDTDNTDVTLLVNDIKEDHQVYSNGVTPMGAKLSPNFSEGRGPEVFMIRKSPKTTYQIQALYQSNRQQTLKTPTTVHAKIITNWNRPNQNEQNITLRLTKVGQISDIAEITIDN